MAWRLVAAVLAILTVAKTIGGIAVIGPIALTIAAIIQLYLPLWRATSLERDYDFVGLDLSRWREDAKGVALLMAVFFPPYIVAHHFYLTQGHGVLSAWGFEEIARFVPVRKLELSLPDLGAPLLDRTLWFGEMAATHVLGVALPEETFYRGYLQPRLESLWRPARRWFGVPLGRAALVSSGLFALGHVLGEWNPLRVGPFFPGLAFAWLRNRSQTVIGAIAFHAACNILGEVLFSFYIPM